MKQNRGMGKYGMGQLDMEKGDRSPLNLPDSVFHPNSIVEDVMAGKHDAALRHLSPTQLAEVIALIERSGVFTEDNFSDDLDSSNDILQHLHKLEGIQYVEYVMLMISFDGPED